MSQAVELRVQSLLAAVHRARTHKHLLPTAAGKLGNQLLESATHTVKHSAEEHCINLATVARLAACFTAATAACLLLLSLWSSSGSGS